MKTHYFPGTVLSPFYVIRMTYCYNEYFLLIDSDFISIKNEFVKFFFHAQHIIRKFITSLVTKQEYIKTVS